MQPTFESELRKNLDNFKNDKLDYVHEYRNAGPMQTGLTPREASDKLILFQVRQGNSVHYQICNIMYFVSTQPRTASRAFGVACKPTRAARNSSACPRPITPSWARSVRS